MSADRVPNKNFLSPLNFKFTLKRAPHVNFFVQKVNVPGLSLPEVDVSNPLIRVPYPGDHLLYEELSLTFRVDENLQNYMELHTWLRSLGKRSFEEYRSMASNSKASGEGIRSDLSLTVLTSSRNANYEVVFKDAFPISLTGMEFNSTDADVDYIEATSVFRYVTYDIVKVQ